MSEMDKFLSDLIYQFTGMKYTFEPLIIKTITEMKMVLKLSFIFLFIFFTAPLIADPPDPESGGGGNPGGPPVGGGAPIDSGMIIFSVLAAGYLGSKKATLVWQNSQLSE